MYLQKGQNKDDKIEKKRLVSEILANTFTGFVFKHPVPLAFDPWHPEA